MIANWLGNKLKEIGSRLGVTIRYCQHEPMLAQIRLGVFRRGTELCTFTLSEGFCEWASSVSVVGNDERWTVLILDCLEDGFNEVAYR